MERLVLFHLPVPKERLGAHPKEQRRLTSDKGRLPPIRTCLPLALPRRVTRHSTLSLLLATVLLAARHSPLATVLFAGQSNPFVFVVIGALSFNYLILNHLTESDKFCHHSSHLFTIR